MPAIVRRATKRAHTAVPRFRRVLVTTAAGLALVAGTSAVRAQDNLFAGETIEMLSGFSEGAVSGVVLQDLARTVERLYPDTRIIYRSNPGGTDALNAEMIAEADPDGLTLGTVSISSMIDKAVGEAERDISDFDIVVSVGRASWVVFATTASGITSAADLVGRSEPAFLPVRGTTSSMYYRALLANAAAGTRIKPVTGYGASERELAFINGEVQLGILAPDAAENTLAAGTSVAILGLSNAPPPDGWGNPPNLSDLPIDPEFAWIPGFLGALDSYMTLGVPKGVPPERLEALREMFFAAANDPQFIANTGDSIILKVVDGASLQSDVERVLEQVPAFAEGLNRALDCGLQIADTGEPCT